MAKRPETFEKGMTRTVLETYPGAGRADRIMDGQFNEAISLSEAALEYPTISDVGNTIEFQIDLIDQEDTASHCCDEVVNLGPLY